MAVLFLDFDGVLHPEPCDDPMMLFCKAPLLVRAMHGLDIEVVISSDWRLAYRFWQDSEEEASRAAQRAADAAIAHLPGELRRRVAGVTGHLNVLRAEVETCTTARRQAEIEAWLAEHRSDANWIALDDRASNFEQGCTGLFLCDAKTGLTWSRARQLRHALCNLTNRDGDDETFTEEDFVEDQLVYGLSSARWHDLLILVKQLRQAADIFSTASGEQRITAGLSVCQLARRIHRAYEWFPSRHPALPWNEICATAKAEELPIGASELLRLVDLMEKDFDAGDLSHQEG